MKTLSNKPCSSLQYSGSGISVALDKANGPDQWLIPAEKLHTVGYPHAFSEHNSNIPENAI